MKKYHYFKTEKEARNAAATISAAQAKNKTFYNIELKRTKNGFFSVIVG